MKRGLLVFLAMCAFAIAMVPLDRQAVNTTTPMEKPKNITTVCESHTPCFWSVYWDRSNIKELNITNTYCICGSGTVCVQDEDDTGVSSYVFRCREPEHDEKADDEKADDVKADDEKVDVEKVNVEKADDENADN